MRHAHALAAQRLLRPLAGLAVAGDALDTAAIEAATGLKGTLNAEEAVTALAAQAAAAAAR